MEDGDKHAAERHNSQPRGWAQHETNDGGAGLWWHCIAAQSPCACPRNVV